MDWKGVGNAVIKAGAPLLGGALFGPAGAAVGSIIAAQFGVSPDATPDQVLTAIKGDPDAALKLREIETTHVERLQELENERLRIETADVQSARHDKTLIKVSPSIEGLFILLHSTRIRVYTVF